MCSHTETRYKWTKPVFRVKGFRLGYVETRIKSDRIHPRPYLRNWEVC